MDLKPNPAEEKIEPTPEEYAKIMEAFKQPEFRKLFDEYCQEISDPKNREVLRAQHHVYTH
jgi:hypothetical protein